MLTASEQDKRYRRRHHAAPRGDERNQPPPLFGGRDLFLGQFPVLLRFVQGQRILDISRRLSMSESDLYRKQRVAINQVAQVLADLEQSETALEKETEKSKVN